MLTEEVLPVPRWSGWAEGDNRVRPNSKINLVLQVSKSELSKQSVQPRAAMKEAADFDCLAEAGQSCWG